VARLVFLTGKDVFIVSVKCVCGIAYGKPLTDIVGIYEIVDEKNKIKRIFILVLLLLCHWAIGAQCACGIRLHVFTRLGPWNRSFGQNDKPAGNNELSSLDRTHYTHIPYTTHVGLTPYYDSIIISVLLVSLVQYLYIIRYRDTDNERGVCELTSSVSATNSFAHQMY